MNVYVESNFVLEEALEQEQSETCQKLLEMASTGAIRLVIPAFSLAEPHIALTSRKKARDKLHTELQSQLKDLARSKSYRALPGRSSQLAAVLIESTEREHERLQAGIATILRIAEVIPLDSTAARARRASAAPDSARPHQRPDGTGALNGCGHHCTQPRLHRRLELSILDRLQIDLHILQHARLRRRRERLRHRQVRPELRGNL